MDLFSSLKISSDCYLCGCTVNNHHQINDLSQFSRKNIHIQSKKAPIICHYCHQRLPSSGVTCVVCGLPLTNAHDHSTEIKIDTPCGKCLNQSPHFNRTISGFHYETPIKEFITHLKYSAQFQLLPLLCDKLIENIHMSYNDANLPSALIAVPLHPNKLVQRGFNQSQLIASYLSKALAIELCSKGIHRIKETQAQSGLNSVERKKNVKGAFQISRVLPEHIAIVDDVVTTGMTVSEITKQAKLQGVKKVDIWCLARAYDL